jgi:hypothetical protein
MFGKIRKRYSAQGRWTRLARHSIKGIAFRGRPVHEVAGKGAGKVTAPRLDAILQSLVDG